METKRNTFAAVAIVIAAMLGSSRTARGEQSDWRVGLASVRITPEGPIAMSGYAPRVSEGVLDDLYAKAAAFEDAADQRALLLTADLLFFRAPFAEVVCGQIAERTGLGRRQIQLNASHTHSGPVFGIKDPDRFDLSEAERKQVDAYTKKLQGQLVELARAALADMKPARLSWGTGAVDFVINRRRVTEEGVRMGPNPEGPVDRNVPVLRVDSPHGRMRALVFGCACHNVTLDGHNLKISGDYAGLAQRYVEDQFPGVQAMFVTGCGADANTHPRGGTEQERLVRQHGGSLGREVCRLAALELQPVGGPLRVELEWTDLPIEHTMSREHLQKIADGSSYWHARNARGMLQVLDRNQSLPTHYRAPIALWQFGSDLTWVGLPGEAVAEYVPMLEKALGPERLWIAAYSNESFGYLPSAKVLAEGGHETIGLTLEIGFFTPSVQDVVIAKVRQLARNAGRTLPP